MHYVPSMQKGVDTVNFSRHDGIQGNTGVCRGVHTRVDDAPKLLS